MVMNMTNLAMNKVVFMGMVFMPCQPIPCKAQPGTTTLTAMVAPLLLLLLLILLLLLLILLLLCPWLLLVDSWQQVNPALAPAREVKGSKPSERT
jgi:hypothetical protein